MLQNQQSAPLPPNFPGEDLRFPSALIVEFLPHFTVEHDVVFDPFAGFGTTLIAAESMGRAGYGIESEPHRFAYAQSRLHNPERLLLGDSLKLGDYQFPSINFSFTSPPYMNNDYTKNPLRGDASGSYAQYLEDLKTIYTLLASHMKTGAYAVIEAANLCREGQLTTLAWDIAGAVSTVLTFEREIVICWAPTYGYGYDHSYCLVFYKSN